MFQLLLMLLQHLATVPVQVEGTPNFDTITKAFDESRTSGAMREVTGAAAIAVNGIHFTGDDGSKVTYNTKLAASA